LFNGDVFTMIGLVVSSVELSKISNRTLVKATKQSHETNVAAKADVRYFGVSSAVCS
jgi:hypothetical protein